MFQVNPLPKKLKCRPLQFLFGTLRVSTVLQFCCGTSLQLSLLLFSKLFALIKTKKKKICYRKVFDINYFQKLIAASSNLNSSTNSYNALLKQKMLENCHLFFELQTF